MAVSAARAAPLAPDAAALHSVLTTPAGKARFRDVPVDWHDHSARTWRPTAIAAAGAAAARVDVFVPIDDGVAIAPAPIEDLRLADGQSDAVTRFWTIRYRMRLFRVLAATLEPEEAELVDIAVRDLAGAEAEMRDVWLTAYAHGVPPRHPRTLLRPSDVHLIGPRAGDGDSHGSRHAPASAGNVLVRAVSLYRAELVRLQGALWEAGVEAGAVKRHPLCATLCGLLAAAAADLLRRDPRGGPVLLDPAVWG